MIFDKLSEEFYRLIEDFESKQIDFDTFCEEFSSFGENTAIAVGEELFTKWANIDENYLNSAEFYLKMEEKRVNPGQIFLF
ncbi:hypothetical protein [Vagococcus fluvialis]|uniref:hypothetical protein n=1 Tax=Vagococcus fluvialis TaxID=2738 RepID=UPI003B227664